MPASQKESSTPQSPPSPTNVPKGRTTLHLNKARGVITAGSTHSSSPSHVADSKEEALQDEGASLSPAPSSQNTPDKKEDPLVLNNTNDTATPTPPPNQPDSSESSPLPNSTIRAAALKTKASKKSAPAYVDPNTMIFMPTRVPKQLKDDFTKACHDKGMTPSIVIRNLMKSFIGLCLCMFFSIQAAGTPSVSYSTDDIFSFLCAKAYPLTSIVPDVKVTASARQSLWNNGQHDSTDYIYLDRSTTRLEARLDIPLLDLGYLRDRSHDKTELRTNVMKALSKILAAQKSVKVLEERSSALRTRVAYTQNQVNLKLAGKNDLFPLEDQFYSVQSQLFDAQSTLDQRIIELASIAGQNWKEAFTMIQKWDGILF